MVLTGDALHALAPDMLLSGLPGRDTSQVPPSAACLITLPGSGRPFFLAGAARRIAPVRKSERIIADNVPAKRRRVHLQSKVRNSMRIALRLHSNYTPTKSRHAAGQYGSGALFFLRGFVVGLGLRLLGR